MILNPDDDHGALKRAAMLLRRGGGGMFGLALLALSLVTFSSYQLQLQALHDRALHRMVEVQEALDRQGAQVVDYLKRLTAWREASPALQAGPLLAASGDWREFELNLGVHSSAPAGGLWVKPHVSPSQPRVASILYLAYKQHLDRPWLLTAVLVDRSGDFLASVPPVDAGTLQRTLAWIRGLGALPPGKVQWVLRLRRQDGPCDCLIAYSPVELPAGKQGVLIETIPLGFVDHLFEGPGGFALFDAGRELHASSGYDGQHWREFAMPAEAGTIALEHHQGRMLFACRLRFIPWLLVFTPARADELAPEWRELLLHALPWLVGALCLLWGYLVVRRLLLKPTENALAAFERYQAQLRQNNETLRRAKEQAEEANRARALFLAVMSHEIRTPLNGLTAMVELLGKGPLDAAQQQALGLIRTSSDLLLRVIGDVLDFTRIQSGRVEFVPEPVDVASLIHDLAETERARLELSGKPVVLEVQPPDLALPYLMLDPYRLRQIIGNLLSNAIKFTASGQVVMAYAYDAGALIVSVRDSGIGMNQEQLARLFQPFVQADATTARRFGGSGLGLAIIKGLLDQAGGAIQVESHPGEGSIFRIGMPCLISPEARQKKPRPTFSVRSVVAKRKGAVWVVEDHPINQAALKAQMETLGVHARFVDSGDALLAQLAIAPGAALVLTDISMPGMDGFELTRRIKSTPLLADIPVVALSAHAFPEDIERGKAAGMDDYLTKPVSLQMLKAMLLREGVAIDDADLSVEHKEVAVSGLNVSGLMTLFSDDAHAVRGFIERFLSCDGEDLIQLRQAWARRDLARLGGVAHRMGSAALYLDTPYAEALYALEAMVEQADDIALGKQFEAVCEIAARVTAQCQAWLME